MISPTMWLFGLLMHLRPARIVVEKGRELHWVGCNPSVLYRCKQIEKTWQGVLQRHRVQSRFEALWSVDQASPQLRSQLEPEYPSWRAWSVHFLHGLRSPWLWRRLATSVVSQPLWYALLLHGFCIHSVWSTNVTSNKRLKSKLVSKDLCTAYLKLHKTNNLQSSSSQSFCWFSPYIFAKSVESLITSWSSCQEDPTLAIFEDVDGGSERVCRGSHPGWWLCCNFQPVPNFAKIGDNSLSYFTLSKAESKEENAAHGCIWRMSAMWYFEGIWGWFRIVWAFLDNSFGCRQQDCQRQCSMATGRCTGVD